MENVVNITKAATICNVFYIFLSAAKASLLPFLTLFFRLMGLSAWETGVIMAAKTLTSFVWAPLWARCAVTYNKRRLVLCFSVFMMGIMYLSFIPVYYKVGMLPACARQNLNDSVGEHGVLFGNRNASMLEKNGQGQEIVNQLHSQAAGTKSSVPSLGLMGPLTGTRNGTSPMFTQAAPVSTTGNQSGVQNGFQALPAPNSNGVTLHPAKTDQVLVPGLEEDQDSTASSHVTSEGDIALLKDFEKRLEKLGYSVPEKENNSSEQLLEMIRQLKQGDSEKALDLVDWRRTSKPSSTLRPLETVSHTHSRHERNLNITFWNNMKEGFSMLASKLEEKKLLLLLIILLVVIFGEFFSSPIEKIADDAWFDFLERIDDMERYGQQRYWGSFAFALVPIMVTMLVDYTPCEVLHLHHFLLHFHVFGIFIIFTLAAAFYFPMPPPLKQKYVSKVMKGFRIICCECRGFLFIFTLFIAGMVYASFNNFLFWHLQDLGASELTMGLCVSVAAFAETPMLICSGKLVRRLGNGWVVALALLVLSLRLLYYGFLWTPWAVLPVELTNAFTHTALWYAILSYSEFNVAPATDRSIRSILSSFYFGLGFAAGSSLSGVVFEICGASVLFWGASIIAAVWCIVYSIIQRCLPKKEKVKYIRLLRKEDNDSSDGEDDWLEMALKDQ